MELVFKGKRQNEEKDQANFNRTVTKPLHKAIKIAATSSHSGTKALEIRVNRVNGRSKS